MQLLTTEERKDLFTTALEGGSNYWYELNENEFYDKLDHKKDLAYSEKLWEFIMKGNSVNVYDLEDEGELLGIFDRKAITKAEKVMFKKHRYHFGDILTENWDASTADVWFQLAVMGEVRFG